MALHISDELTVNFNRLSAVCLLYTSSPKCTICKSCGEEAVQKQAVRYGEWSYAGDISCVHEGGGDWYQDEKQVRLVFYPAVCKKCGISDTECKIEERFIHIGDRKKIQYIL